MGEICSEEECDGPSMEDYELCAYHRGELEEERQNLVKGGLGVLTTIAVIVLGRGNGGGS